ncbi:MAG: hypothetical protein N2Z76_06270 [Treponemataceae bacterium]|nr:hypothetical protein [Treponemataceae bacterium]
MKKGIVLTGVLFFLLASILFAADKKTTGAPPPKTPEPLFAPGDIALTGGVGYGFLWGAIDLSGGAEYIIGKFLIADFLPFTYGIAGKIAYYSWHASYDTAYRDTYLGGGVFATLHFGLKNFDFPEGFEYLRNVDTYIGLGAGLYNWTYGYASNTESAFRVGFRTTAGISYFFTPQIGITTEGGYYGYYSTGLLGIIVKW